MSIIVLVVLILAAICSEHHYLIAHHHGTLALRISHGKEIMTDNNWVEVPSRHGRKMRQRDDNDDGGDEVVYNPSKRSPRRNQPVVLQPSVLILVGLPGSGKSHFASQLCSSMPDTFLRINQDSLGTRRKCEALARKALAEGKVAIIDRCNFDSDQRKTWIGIAEKESVNCDCVVFDFDKDICVSRCQKRRGHETVHPSKAAGVVSLVARQFRPPVPRVKHKSGHVECFGGERFCRFECVSSFDMADNLVKSYLRQDVS